MAGKTLTSSLIVRLIDQVSGPARKVSGALLGINKAATGSASVTARLAAAQERNNAALDASRGRMADALVGMFAFKAAIGAVLRPTIELEEALADLRKVTGVDDSGLKGFEQAVKRVSAATGRAQSEVAATMAAAAQAGVGNDDLEAYSEMVLQTAVAWDVAGDAAGEALAKMQTAMGWTVDQTKIFGDQINTLADTTASSAPDLLEFARRTLAFGKAAGLSAKETLAFGSAMISAGTTPDVAATSFLNFTRALTKGKSATKAQRAALEELNIDAEQLAKNMQKDAFGAGLDVLERIQKAPAHERVSLMNRIFGEEARGLGPILNDLELLRKNYEAIRDDAKTAGSVQREFAVRSKTTQNAVNRLSNAIEGIAIALGQALTPALADAAEAFAPIATKIADLVGRFPRLTQVVVGTVAGLTALRIGLIGLSFVGLNIRGAMISAALGITRLGGAAATAASSAVGLQRALGAMSGIKPTTFQTITTGLMGMVRAVPGVALIGSAISAVGAALATITAPVWGAIAVGVAAVAAAGAMLYKYWDRITSVLSGVGRAIGEVLSPAIEAAKPLFDWLAPIGDAIAAGWDKATEALKAFGEWIGSFFGREVLSDEQKAEWEKAGYDAAMRMITAIKEVFAGLVEWAKDIGSQIGSAIAGAATSAINTVKGWVGLGGEDAAGGGSDIASRASANNAGSSLPTLSGHRANGGPAWPGGAFLVGEKGPEIFTPNTSGRITPNGGGGGTTIHAPITLTVSGFSGDARQLAREVKREFEKELRIASRGLHADMGARD